MTTAIANSPTVDQLGKGFGRLIEQKLETVFRTLFRGPQVVNERHFMRLVTNQPHPLGNFAVVSDPANLDHTKAAIAPLLKMSAPTAVIFSGPASNETASFVTALGYILAETMPAMGVDIDSLAAAPLPAGYALAEYSSIADDAQWCDAFTEGYGIPRLVSDMFGPKASHDAGVSAKTRYFGIAHEGVIVCTSMVYLDQGIAGVYGVSTRPPHRGKGLGAHATAEPLRRLRPEGYRTALLQASAMGAPVYRRLGFKEYGSLPLYVRMPAGMAMPH